MRLLEKNAGAILAVTLWKNFIYNTCLWGMVVFLPGGMLQVKPGSGWGGLFPLCSSASTVAAMGNRNIPVSPRSFPPAKMHREGGYGRQAHLMADDFGLQGLANHSYEQIQAHKTHGQASGASRPGYECPGKKHGARAKDRQNIHQRGDAGKRESGRNAQHQETDIKFRKCQGASGAHKPAEAGRRLHGYGEVPVGAFAVCPLESGYSRKSSVSL